ncbi:MULTISPECIES: hypothetical protein [Streptomyces]|uniref:hypothetical protein n=1 Tax=Streptomyces TaxID=1883 RepID=UPI00140CDC44|nr:MULTISPECIES: hypothetical protein [Streptomyces]MDH6228047.1 hypothetical protein [Streptomyces sp. MJP52]
MWPGQQPPGGEQNPSTPQQPVNPYQQPGYQQQPNPYQQPGYQQQPQHGPYAPTPQGPWGPATPAGPAQPPGGPADPSRRTRLVAVVAASAVVLTAAVTGFLVLGDDGGKAAAAGDGKPSPSASKSASPKESGAAGENPRGGEGPKPTVPGWKVVVNPKWGTAFDVPADWEVESPDTFIGFEEDGGEIGKPLIVMSAPAYYKSKWCVSDDDKDGREDDTALAAVGTKGANGAKSTDEVALNHSPIWVFGGYTQPDKKSIKADKKAEPYTTASGVEGSIAWARSENTPAKGKCATDGKAVTFGFKNSKGDFVAWSLYGASGVDDELSEDTIMKILDTVRLEGTPTG